MKIFLSIAGVLGFLGVAIGAFGAHALKDYFNTVEPKYQDIFHTATQYQMYHVFALLAVAILVKLFPEAKLFPIAGWCFLAGIILFSGSLYALSLSKISVLGAVTPFGGLCFLTGWGLLLFQGSKLA